MRSPGSTPPSARFARIHNAGWNMVVLLRCRLQYSLFRPILPSLHRPLGALGSNPLSGQACGNTYQELSPQAGKVDTKWPKGERLKAAKCRDMFPLRLTSFDSSPAGGGAFWHCTQGLILYFKLSPFTGKVDTNEVSGRKGNNLQLFVFAINQKTH